MIRIFRHTICVLLAAVAFAASASPASAGFITTVFASNNNGGVGGANYFDVNVLDPSGITIQSIAVNTNTVGSPLQVNVYARNGTAFGSEGNSAGWTLVSSGTGTSAGLNNPSLVTLTPFNLNAGVTGLAIHAVNYASFYTNGTGANQFYSNSDLTLTMGTATNVLFNTPLFTPRVWNGTIDYTVNEVNPVPAPAGAILFAIGAVGLAGGRALRRRMTPAAA